MVKNELKLGFGCLHWVKNRIRLTRSEHKFREIKIFLGPLIAHLQKPRVMLYIRQTTTLKSFFDNMRLSPGQMNRRKCLLTPPFSQGSKVGQNERFQVPRMVAS